MWSAFVLAFVILLNPFLSAPSSGLALASKADDHPSHTSALKLSFSLDNDLGRTLNQESEDQCPSCLTLRQDVYNETMGAWIVDDAVLYSNAVNIQCVVSCAKASETVMLLTNRTFIPNEKITIDKPLTITEFHQGVPNEEGIYPAAEKKTVISCPEGSDQGIFDIQTGGVTIANLQIRDCSMEGDDSPVVIRNCEGNTKGVQIHHVDFVNNTHNSQLVTTNYAEPSSCGTLELMNITFKDNQAKGSAAIARFGSATIMKNIRLEGNARADNGTGEAAFVFTSSDTRKDSVKLNGLVATGNQIPILRAKSGTIKIFSSSFRQNDLQTQTASMLQFSFSSEIEVRDSIFENNAGAGRGMITTESVPFLEMLGSTFTNNTKFGSLVFSTGSELNIQSSSFSANNGTSNGGVIHLANSTARLNQSFFNDNISEQNGGTCYAGTNSTLAVQDSNFSKNEAHEGGCFYVEDSNVEVLRSTFQRNKAEFDGGAIFVERGGVVCDDSMFEENKALDDGGAINIVTAKYVTLQNSNFRLNNASYGSAVRIVKSRTDVNWNNVSFKDGVAGLSGAGANIDDSSVTIVGATFENNTAPYGGTIYAQSFDITIKDTKFLENNAPVMGGAISGDSGIISFERVVFEKNNSTLGGALHFYHTTFNASEIVFLNNEASEGAGLMCKESEVAIAPRPGIEVIISDSRQGHPDSSFGIYARDNRGIDGGGVIDVKESNVTIAYGNFVKNQAPEGGAIQVTSSQSTSLIVSHSRLEENVADVRGGGLAVRSANEGYLSMKLSFTNFSRCVADQGGALFLTSVNAVIEGCKFVDNAAIEGGAGLFQKNVKVIWDGDDDTKSDDISIDVKNCSFKGNRATDLGGALMLRGEMIVNRSSSTSEEESPASVYAMNGFRVSLESVNLTKNRAHLRGGGVFGNSVSLDIRSVEVKENNASTGGGVYLKRTKMNISDSNIVSNQAESSGGGIELTRQSNGTISKTSFTDNKVSEDGEGEGGGLTLSGSTVRGKNLNFTWNKAAYGGGVSLVPGSKCNLIAETLEVDSRLLCYECIFSGNKASKSGGGLNIESQNREVPVMAQLDRCQFTHNSASVFGGGIHFVRTFNRTTCTMDWTSCSHLVILDSSFTDNTAKRGGGSLISNDRERVLFSCSQSTDNANPIEFINVTRAKSLRANQQELCPQWIDCRGNKSDCPLLVSSYVRSCNITEVREGRKSEPSGISIQINETVPGERLPDIFIECYDEFGHVSKSGDDSFTATLKSKEEGSLMGIFVTDLQEGIGKFTGVRNPPKEGFNSSYSYELEISFSLDYVKPITVLINVRECRMNEQKEDEGVQCKQCDAAQYNFNPMNKACKSCDDTLNCAGTYVFPEDDYWHSSPCHVPAQKCLTSYACEETVDLQAKINNQDFSNISAALKSFSCDFSNVSKEEYQKLQCKEGYKGVLCGSCKEDYGRSLNFACTKCNAPAVCVVILGSLCIWLALVAAITIRGSMTIEERLAIIRAQLHDITSLKGSSFQDSQSASTAQDDKKKEKEDSEKTRVVPFPNMAHRRALKAAARLSDMFQWLRQNHHANDVATTVKTPEEIENLRLSQLAKWKLCEVFKVAVNFLQAISVAAVINVEWTTYMLTMFRLSAFAGGASTALATGAIQCFPWWNGTRYATYSGLVAGILVPTFVILCIVAFFAFLAYKASKGMYYFVKKSTLATLAICYFSYLSITKIAVMVFYCIRVHTDDDFSSDKETYYWALDTSIECAERDHIWLMVFGGMLFMVFSVGFPLLSAFILVPYRGADRSRDPIWMTDILGFLYRAYKREFIFWESTTMLRKALLSAIAVFSYHLGGHSQGLLASCILFVCLFFQAIYKPYRIEFDVVNNIESLSLLISGLTFTLAQFFTKDRTNGAVKVALTVSLMVSIIVFLSYLLSRMVVCLIDVLRTDLKVVGQLTADNESSLSVVGIWVSSKLGLSERLTIDEDKGDVEMGSMNGKDAADDQPSSSAQGL